MRKLPPLATLRAFEAAARHLSFKRAADELAVTPTAISHQIRLLEDTLGQKLFERQTRRVILTPAGQMLYSPLRNSFDTIAQAIERVRATKSASTVTVTAMMAFTSKWLVPRVAAFRTRFQGINLRLLASDDVIDLGAGAADIAVRYGTGVLRSAASPPCGSRAGSHRADDGQAQALQTRCFALREDDPPRPAAGAAKALHLLPLSAEQRT